ncbi:transcription factor 21-like [Oncorhynchus nerka]|uniref:transcription factor 21-like n=1 Tax=Oncorhynchus nerka TaxID=8023 RepID=UPI001131D84E|nr:transcription factor 21-like [Oncorhynchus nerka]
MSSLLGLEEEEEEGDTQRGARSPQSPAVLVHPVPHSAEATRPNRPPNMSTGSLSDFDDEVLDGILKFGSSGKDSGTSNESTEESSNCEGGSANDKAAAGKKRKTAYSRKKAPNSVAHEGCGKPVQRNAANARERARMRVLSKAFSRLKMTLPWVPPDTKLSKLDTLRLASSYIAHLRQILANDKYENGYYHPVNLTWPFMVAGKPENDLKEMLNTTRLCGTTAS